MAAKYLARNGLSVELVDIKDRENIGEKVCGDAIAKHHFLRVNLDFPSGDELRSNVSGLAVYSPDNESALRVKGEGMTGFMIDRHKFGQRLLNEAISSGARLHDKTRVVEAIVKEGQVLGVSAEDLRTGQTKTMHAPITIDASGYGGALRSKLPPDFNVEANVETGDAIVAYREIRGNVNFASDLSEIHLNQDAAPGGYYWIFDRGRGEVNVGLGVQTTPANPNPKEHLYKYVLSQEFFKDSKLVEGGGGIVPTRRPLLSLVANGIMFIGDAACVVNPIHGGGIGPSMLSGKLAAETAIEALEKHDLTREGLWGLNTAYMRTYGAKQAALDVFRMLLQPISDEELNFGLRNELVTSEDVLNANTEGELKYSISQKAMRGLRGIGRPRFLGRLKKTAELMRKAKQIYQEYPDPAGLESWKARVDSIFSQRIYYQI